MVVHENFTAFANSTPRGVHSYTQALFATGFDANAAYDLLSQNRGYYVNSTLSGDEWVQLDQVVSAEFIREMVAVQDLRNAGLVRPESIGTSIAEYSRRSAAPGATVAMSPLANVPNFRADFTREGVPLPFTMEGFQLDMRTLAASQMNPGAGLDVDQAADAARMIGQTLELMTVLGLNSVVRPDHRGNLNTIEGYTSPPNRVTGAAVGPWNDAVNGFVNIINTVEAMKTALRRQGTAGDRGVRGPYWLYVGDNNHQDLGQININTDTRARTLLEEDPEIASIGTLHHLPNGEVLLVAIDRNVVQWVEAMDIQTFEWDEQGQLGSNFKILAVGVPLVKATHSGVSGVAHFTGAR